MPTLIGNKRRFAIEIVPISPNWERRYAKEAQAWGGLAIWVDDRNICSHVQAGSSEVDHYFFVPLGPIAEWLVMAFPALRFEERSAVFPTGRRLHHDVRRWGESRAQIGFDEDAWLEAREAWWSRHFIRSGADGARLPDLAFVRDDERLVLSWAAPHFVGGPPPVMVWPEGESDLPWTEGAEILDRFVRYVGDEFESTPNVYPRLALTHPLDGQPVDIASAVQLYAARDLHALEALTDTTDPTDALTVLGLSAESVDPAESPHCQMLRDLSGFLSPDLGALVVDTGARALVSDERRRADWFAGRDLALDAARAGTTPEQAGTIAAEETRRRSNLDGEPLRNVTDFVTQFGAQVNESQVDGQGDRMMTCGRSDGSAWITTMRTPRTESPWGRNFEHARGLGHLLLDPVRGGALGAASGPYAHAARRRRSGAFAANLLLPAAALARASGGSLDGITHGQKFERLLESFGVGARAAAFQLWNQGWLSSRQIRDELVDRFAHCG
jgi:hypothetical protein